jgi:hypothetical protein
VVKIATFAKPENVSGSNKKATHQKKFVNIENAFIFATASGRLMAI